MSDEESVERIVNGIHGVLRELRMKEGGPAPVARPVYLDPTEVVTSPETGILYAHAECNQTAPRGALLAHITDFFGKTIGEVRSPLDGLCCISWPPRPSARGNRWR
jgi:predicted deacylase